MSQHLYIDLEIPDDLQRFKLPKAVNNRLQELLDRQDRGKKLTEVKRREAQGLVNLADLLSPAAKSRAVGKTSWYKRTVAASVGFNIENTTLLSAAM